MPQPDERRDDAADHRTERGPEPLRGLHDADRLRHPVARRRVGRHRQRQRAVAGEEALDGAQREHVPRPRDERHRRHDDDEAHERPLDHDLAAEAVGEPAPDGRQQRGQRRRDAEAQTRTTARSRRRRGRRARGK